MPGFALGDRKIPIADYPDPTSIAEGFEVAHQLLFALAASQLMNSTHTPTSRSDCLGFGQSPDAVLGHILLEPTESTFERAWRSLKDLMSIFPDHEREDRIFLHSGDISALQLETKLWGERFALRLANDEGITVRTKIRHYEEDEKGRRMSKCLKAIETRKQIKVVRPFELGYLVGLGFFLALLCGTILLVVLYKRMEAHGGLARPAQSVILVQLMINYLPTAFAMAVEPTWTLLNRLLCILQPFELLRSGNAPAASSVDLRYTSMPPQIVLVRALRAKHFLLTSVCAMALFSSILAVALSSAFQDRQQGETPLDHNYLLFANVTGRSSLPRWTNDEYYFLPLAPANVFGNGSALLHSQAVTAGVGLSPICSVISSNSNVSELALIASDGLAVGLEINPSIHSSSLAACIAGQFRSILFVTGPLPADASSSDVVPVAVEIVQQIQGCVQGFLVGWVRAEASLVNGATSVQSRELYVLACQSVVQTADFSTMVGSNQQILSATLILAFKSNTSDIFAPNLDITTFMARINQLLRYSAVNSQNSHWHSTAIASDHFNTILRHQTNGTMTDPHVPLPEESTIVPLVESVIKTLFPIILSLSPDNFESIANSTTGHSIPIQGKRTTLQHRMFLDEVATLVAISILSLMTVVAIVLYARRPGKWLPRMPTSTASVLAYMSATRQSESAPVSRSTSINDHAGSKG
ncbi:hypothetical protein MMC25_007718 [Agyrium rufum]|nr:hypothetical protein [Agyrium rufum]